MYELIATSNLLQVLPFPIYLTRLHSHRVIPDCL